MKTTVQVLLFGTFYLFTTHVLAQGFGAGGSYDSGSNSEYHFAGTWEASRLSPEEALSFITIEGVAERRVVPEEIRVVMAVTGEAVTAVDCHAKSDQQVKRVVAAWRELGIKEDKIVEDFIAVLPRYEWRLAERDDSTVRIQQRVGYRIQTNLHVAVADEEAAMQAVHAAFQQDVTDIVTFDYWSSKLNEEKEMARASAVDAAKKKAGSLLDVFETRPKLINLQENTAVFFPRSLYRTYENVLEEEVSYSRIRDDIPRIKAFRPRMTFFDGLKSESDRRPPKLDMRPDIAVVSTVRLYFESPASKSPASVAKR